MNTSIGLSLRNMTLLIVITIWFCACDCHQIVSGTVLDQETGKVLMGVYVQKANKNINHAFTDSLGYFEIHSISGGFRCPPMEVALTKAGYEIKLVEIESRGGDTIYLERIQ